MRLEEEHQYGFEPAVVQQKAFQSRLTRHVGQEDQDEQTLFGAVSLLEEGEEMVDEVVEERLVGESALGVGEEGQLEQERQQQDMVFLPWFV